MVKLVAVLAIALAGSGAAAGWLWHQLQDERRLNAELQDRVTALEVAQEAAALAPPPEPAAATEVANATAPVAAPTATPQAASQRQSAAVGEAARAMLSTDAGKDLTRTMLRGVLTQQYPDLGKELGLTPEQANELMDVLARQLTEASSDSMNLLTGNGGPDAMRDLQRKTQERERANEAEIAALLGSKYPKFQEYQGTQTARQQVNQLQTALGTGGITALTDSQKQGLITALGAEQKRIAEDNRNAQAANPGAQAGSPNYVEQQIQQAEDNSRRLVNAASGYLNPQQLEAYRKMLDQQQEMLRGVMRAFGGARSGSAGN